ncbi:MAG: hypothetical protein L0Y68_00385 [Candidatus Dadabacteria bacterium]|nr:hypothetical protein [Candidatus Dadabacteria bacterium]
MNLKRSVYFYKGKAPLSILPLILFAFIILAVIAILGLFIGAILGAFMVGYIVFRLFIPLKKRKTMPSEQGDRTIVLKEGDYEVIEKGEKS